jgi:hypothetical protein
MYLLSISFVLLVYEFLFCLIDIIFALQLLHNVSNNMG